jgi:hypothetical protein
MKMIIKVKKDYEKEITKTEQLLKRLKREDSRQDYYNRLIANKGFSMFEGWEDNYSDLDIPETWKNSSWTGDEYPSFAYKGWQIWVSEKDEKDRTEEGARFNIGELHNYSTSTVWFWTDDFNKALDFVNSRVAPFIGVK